MKKRVVVVMAIVFVLMITGCGNSKSLDEFISDDSRMAENTEETDTEKSAAIIEDGSENEDDEIIMDSIMLYNVIDMDTATISVDEIEFVQANTKRADELGVKEGEAPSGFYIYNPEIVVEQFVLSENCLISIWENNERKTISVEEFLSILQEREQQQNEINPFPYTFPPYDLGITDGKVTEITEQYLP